MCHTMSPALLWQVASSCYFPFPGAPTSLSLFCLSVVPEGPSAAMVKSGQGARAVDTPKEGTRAAGPA